MNFGFKVSEEGSDAKGLRNLIINSKYPQWKCDVRPNPKHYGLARGNINLAAGESRTILSIPHNYGYTPSYIASWNFPAGVNQSGSAFSSTFGIGTITITNADFTLTTFTPKIDALNFSIVASTTNAQSGLYVEFRFYIFADDFPVGLFGDHL